MSNQDALLVAAMAMLAVIIAGADLCLALLRHRREMAEARMVSVAGAPTPAEEAAAATRETIRRRLAFIQSYMADRESPTGKKPKSE